MRFENGKVYYHTSGYVMKIVGFIETHTYGVSMVGENLKTGEIKPIGFSDDSYAENWAVIKDCSACSEKIESNKNNELTELCMNCVSMNNYSQKHETN